MFSGITNILFGRSSGSDDPQDRQGQTSSRSSSVETALLTTSVEDSDWLFVDKSDVESSEASTETLGVQSELTEQQQLNLSTTSTPSKSESPNTSGSEETSDFERFRGPFLSMQDVDPQSDTALSDVSSQPEHVTHPSLEECWIVTPPPCFTASESNSDVIQMHPLENLLIEHPSMSVYWPRDRLNLDPEDGSENEAEEMILEGPAHEEETQIPEDYRHLGTYRIVDHQTESDLNQVHILRPRLRVPRNGLRRATPEDGRLVENLELLIRRSWSVEDQKAQKWLTNQNNARKCLGHQNRVHEFSSHGKMRARKDRMTFPSGRSNDRKC